MQQQIAITRVRAMINTARAALMSEELDVVDVEETLQAASDMLLDVIDGPDATKG